jgi:hypothetical protein
MLRHVIAEGVDVEIPGFVVEGGVNAVTARGGGIVVGGHAPIVVFDGQSVVHFARSRCGKDSCQQEEGEGTEISQCFHVFLS